MRWTLKVAITKSLKITCCNKTQPHSMGALTAMNLEQVGLMHRAGRMSVKPTVAVFRKLKDQSLYTIRVTKHSTQDN